MPIIIHATDSEFLLVSIPTAYLDIYFPRILILEYLHKTAVASRKSGDFAKE